LDLPIGTAGDGFAGVFHKNKPPQWAGPTGFYADDYRTPPGKNESRVWDAVYVWAAPQYTQDRMWFSLAADTLFPPPRERQYLLELIDVPTWVTGAPAEGTVWEVPPGGTALTLELPAVRTSSGLSGYQFRFTITPAIPEPAGLALSGLAGLLLLVRRAR
jgi:hypothetical protein